MAVQRPMELPSLEPSKPRPSATSHVPPGTVLDGRFYIKALIQAGENAVYEARHVFTEQRLVLKVGPPSNDRLFTEARQLATLKHPCVPRVLDAGYAMELERPYLAMTLAPGRRLDAVLTSCSRLSGPITRSLLVGLSDVLASTQRIVHGAIRPDHIVLHERSTTLVGFSRATTADDIVEDGYAQPPAYLPPEKQLNPAPSSASDLYALAAVGYECLTGAPPHAGAPLDALQLALSNEVDAAHQHASDIDRGLSDVLARALRRNPDERFPSAAAFRDAVAATTPVDNSPQRTDRRAPRAPYCSLLRLNDGRRTISGQTQDISTGGVFLLTRANGALQREVQIHLVLPTSAKVCEVAARVVWSKKGRAGHVLGLSFVDLSEPARNDIATYVRHLGA